jgi:hypothetical protein
MVQLTHHSDLMFVEDRKLSTKRSQKKRKDSTKTRDARLHTKDRNFMRDYKFNQMESNSSTYQPVKKQEGDKETKTSVAYKVPIGVAPALQVDQNLAFNEEIDPMKEMIEKYMFNYNYHFADYNEVTDGLMDVLYDWAIYHSTKKTIDKKQELMFKAIAIQWINRGADVNNSRIIGHLYENLQIYTDRWYFPVKEIQFLLDNGANPTWMLYNLWQVMPSLTIEEFHNYECEVTTIVKAGANLNFENGMMLMYYVSRPWESSFKTDDLIDPFKMEMTYKAIKESYSKMWRSNPYILEYMINSGMDPNIQNALELAINNFLFLMGSMSCVPPIYFQSESVDIYMEDNVYKLAWLTLVILVRFSRLDLVVHAYEFVDSFVPQHDHEVIDNLHVSYRNIVKNLIEVVQPEVLAVLHKKKWASRTIIRAWKTSITSPDYDLCRKRLMKEFEELSGIQHIG